MSVVLWIDLSGKELRGQVEVDGVIASGGRDGVMVSTLAQSYALVAIFSICIAPAITSRLFNIVMGV